MFYIEHLLKFRLSFDEEEDASSCQAHCHPFCVVVAMMNVLSRRMQDSSLPSISQKNGNDGIDWLGDVEAQQRQPLLEDTVLEAPATAARPAPQPSFFRFVKFSVQSDEETPNLPQTRREMLVKSGSFLVAFLIVYSW